MKKPYQEIEFELVAFSINDTLMTVNFSNLDDNELPPDIEFNGINPEIKEH